MTIEKEAEETQELLFNLANVDRLDLLREIDIRKGRLTSLAKVIDVTAQECSRHLARLSDTGLITKDPAGSYETTPLGKAILGLIPAIEFLLKHKDYFKEHDLSVLPGSFVERIGELSGGGYLGHTSQVMEQIRSTVSNAKDYVWIAADQPVKVGRRIGESFSSAEIPVRLLCEPGADPKILAEATSALPNSEIRFLKGLKVMIMMNDSSAGVAFPRLDSKLDLGAGFAGTDAKFREWCRDLFEYYWSKSKRASTA